MLHKINADSGAAEDLFILPDASRKAPSASLSPDGQWIAYRDSQLDSVLLLSVAEGQAAAPRTLVDISGNPDFSGISGMFWSENWLGVGLAGSDSQSYTLLLLDPATCQAYRLDGIGGYLLGLVVSSQMSDVGGQRSAVGSR